MLTDMQCKKVRADPQRAQKLFDGGGLHLFVSKIGHKSWRMKYRFGGREKQLTFGPYPLISIAEARAKRDAAKRQLLDNIDPAKAAQATRAKAAARATTLKDACLRWHALRSEGWKQVHADDVLHQLERDVFAKLGDVPIAEISVANIRKVLDTMQDRGAVDQAHRMRMRLDRIFDLAIVDGLVETNPVRPTRVIMKPVRKRKFKAILNLKDAQAALKAWEAESHLVQLKLASRLLALAVPRPGPLRFAQKGEFFDLDGENPRWVIPAAKMKLERAQSEQAAFAFTIPLAHQSVAVVKAAIERAGNHPYLFPAQWHDEKPLSENALSQTYRESPAFAGLHVPHGWRSTFSTIMNERGAEIERPGEREIIDLMLGHKPEGVEAHYNRAAYMTRRRQIAQEWADMLTAGLEPVETLLI